MLSGYYTLVDPHTFIEDPQKSGYELGQFNFDDWKSIRAEFLVKGSVQVSGGKVQAHRPAVRRLSAAQPDG